ncbi:mucin-17 isoform X1 [Pieris rapae]|uniref:mucin-17 isoform X1 n=1 Tax=Pieris rapae TaxID=64459 RepID=UPI001E279DD1|nr:mucin-17 isoform X1 [Pieris rapae]
MSDNSGVENDFKKSDITKKRNSIKKKVQNFSSEHDDAALVPLLQTNKDKPERNAPSAKFTLPKTKTDSLNEKDIQSVDVEKGTVSKPLCDNAIVVCNPAVVQNHMNTNVFGDMITSEVPKTSVLIEISEKKSSGFGTPLIFTTAKIHTDSKTKAGEPLHVTPVPILSTIEGNHVKSEVTYDKTNILPGKIEPAGKVFEKARDVQSQINNKDDTSGVNQSKSSTNKFADQVKTSVTQPSQSNIATKSDTTKVSTVTTNRTDITQNTNVNSTVLSKSKPDSTSSMKKLQRQKHTEETNIPQNNLFVKKDSDIGKIDIKTNGTTQSEIKRFSGIHTARNSSDPNKSIPAVVSVTDTEVKQSAKSILSPIASKQDITTYTEKASVQKIPTTDAKEIAKSPVVSSTHTSSIVKPTLAQKTITTSLESKEATKSLIMSSKTETVSSIATQKSLTTINTGTESKVSSKVEAASIATQPGATQKTQKTITPIDTGSKGKDAKSLISQKVEAQTVTKPTTTSLPKTTPTASEPKDKSLLSSKIDATSIVKPATATPTINAIKTEVKDATKIPVSSKQEVGTVKTGITATERANTNSILKQEPKASVIPTSTQKMATTNTEVKSAIPMAKPEVIKPNQKTIQTTELKVASTKIPSKPEVLSSVYKPTMAQKTTPVNTGTQDKETTKSLVMSSKVDTTSIATKPVATSTQKTPLNTNTEATKSPISKHEIVKPTQKVPTKGKELPTSIKTPKISAKSDKLKSPTQIPSQSQVPGANKPKSSSEVASNAKTKVPSYIVATSKTKIGTPNKPEDSIASTSSVSKADSKDGKSDTKNPPKS